MEKTVSGGLTIGVTGHRPDRLEITPAQAYRQCRDTLRIVKRALEGAQLCAVSALAEGADRAFARAALDLDCVVEAILPFSPNDYEKTFSLAGDTDDYRALLDQCQRVHALGGDLNKQVQAYVAVGHEIVEASDILLAIWDGGEGSGPGGTTDVIDMALSRGLPVIWIDASGRRPRRRHITPVNTGGSLPERHALPLRPKQLEQLIRTVLQVRADIQCQQQKDGGDGGIRTRDTR